MAVECGAGAGAGTGVGEAADIIGCWSGEEVVCPHHAPGIARLLGHLPCRFRCFRYLIIYWIKMVNTNPKMSSSSRLDPSIWALQLKLKSPVLLVLSEFFIISPKTELSHAP